MPSLLFSTVPALTRGASGFGFAFVCLPCGAAARSAAVALPPAGLLLPLLLALASSALFYLRHRGLLRRARELEERVQQLQTSGNALRRELTALREQEQSARINAERFRSLTSLSSDWYWEQDEQLRFTMRTSWLLGGDPLPQEGFVGRRRWELTGIVSDPGWDEHRRTLEARKPFRGLEYQFRTRNEVRWVSINGEPVFGLDGTFSGYRGTGRDITHRKQVEAALRASEERFHEIIGSMPVGLFIKDADSRITLMNRECERQWGIAFAQIEGSDGSTFFTLEELAGFRDADRRAFAAREIVEFEGATRNFASGEVLAVKELKKPVFDEAGNPRYLIGITVDITERKRAEEQLRQSRELLRQLARHQTRVKEEERKRIARDIHDDLGQNLMALRLEVEAIVKETTGGGVTDNDAADSSQDRRRAHLMMDTVDRTIRSVRHIINDLRPAVLDLGLVAALEWQVKEFARQSGLTCVLEIELDDQELALEDTHATTLFRVLQESLTNVQRHAAASAVSIRLHRDAACLYLTVSDNGKGGVPAKGRRGKQGFGLLGMGERLRMLGGKLEIGNRQEGGAVLVASVPLAGACSDSPQ